MENPVKDIEDVVRGLVEKPTLKRQAAVLQKYFTEDVKFYHFYINTYGGLKDLTAIYQMAEIFVNYQGVEFEKILYDEGENAMALRMSVFTRPWSLLPMGGKTVKKIKVQRDYFERAPLVLMIPIVGQIYDSDRIRTLIGGLLAATFNFFRTIVSYFLPANICHGVMGLWNHDVADANGVKT